MAFHYFRGPILFLDKTIYLILFKLFSVSQPDEDSDEVPLNRIIKQDNQTNKKDRKEEEKDLTKVQIRKPYDVIEIVKSGSKHVEDNKEVECILPLFISNGYARMSCCWINLWSHRSLE